MISDHSAFSGENSKFRMLEDVILSVMSLINNCPDPDNLGLYFIIYTVFRGKKITCPGARDKLNFRQDNIFVPNIRGTSKKFSASLFDNIFRTS